MRPQYNVVQYNTSFNYDINTYLTMSPKTKHYDL